RGTMQDHTARQTRALASDLVACERIDWVSITDNAGGHPPLSPMAPGEPSLFAGQEAPSHLFCKDFNHHGPVSAARATARRGVPTLPPLRDTTAAESRSSTSTRSAC